MTNIQGKERNPEIGATRAQETFHEKSLRRNIKDRRDARRGCLFFGPPPMVFDVLRLCNRLFDNFIFVFEVNCKNANDCILVFSFEFVVA